MASFFGRKDNDGSEPPAQAPAAAEPAPQAESEAQKKGLFSRIFHKDAPAAPGASPLTAAAETPAAPAPAPQSAAVAEAPAASAADAVAQAQAAAEEEKKGLLSRLFGRDKPAEAPAAGGQPAPVAVEPSAVEPVAAEPVAAEPVPAPPAPGAPIQAAPAQAELPPAVAPAEAPAAPAPVQAEAPGAAAAPESAAEAAEAAEKKGLISRLFGGDKEAGPAQAPGPAPASAPAPVDEGEQKARWFSRLKQGLSRTGSALGEGVGTLFLGRKQIDDALMEELESQLVMADVGMAATAEIIANLTKRVARKQLADGDALYGALQEELRALLEPCNRPLAIDAGRKPYVILAVGVNGVGKTTTIGKLAKRFQQEGRSVMLAAGDTFRAAAVEQLQVWGERNGVPVVAQHTGADSASVLFDALQAAQARGVDVLIADTAGRLHNKDHLMEELKKVVRVLKKLDPEAPHEVLLVLDAGTGQNALQQAKIFQQAVGVTGIALTKLDGTAKGGVTFAIGKQLGLPIRFIGVGEGIDDLRPFDADDFVRAIFAR